MDKRSLPMVIIGFLLAVAGIAGYLLPAPHEEVPTRLLMQNNGGRVVFTHLDHSGYTDVSCLSCHHDIAVSRPEWRPSAPEDGTAVPAVHPCGACHDASSRKDFVTEHQKTYAQKEGDASCVSCHHTRFAGYSKNWSHADHENYAADGCQSCHHGEDIEPTPQACKSCHDSDGAATGVSLKAAAHARCMSCHEDMFEEKLKGCKSCHETVPTRDDLAKEALDKNFSACASCHESIPKRMETFHGNCFSCHEARGAGPGSEAPCQHCHTPKGR